MSPPKETDATIERTESQDGSEQTSRSFFNDIVHDTGAFIRQASNTTVDFFKNLGLQSNDQLLGTPPANKITEINTPDSLAVKLKYTSPTEGGNGIFQFFDDNDPRKIASEQQAQQRAQENAKRQELLNNLGELVDKGATNEDISQMLSSSDVDLPPVLHPRSSEYIYWDRETKHFRLDHPDGSSKNTNASKYLMLLFDANTTRKTDY